MRKEFYLIYHCALILLWTSCQGDVLLNNALEQAKENQPELKKVLFHYRNNPEKLAAAKFLIKNMISAYGENDKKLQICDAFYDQYDSLMQVHQYDSLMYLFIYSRKAEWDRQVDSLWNDYKRKNIKEPWKELFCDLQKMTSLQLINEIDLSFISWKSNVYMRDCTFDDFCEYILPYRRMNGLIIDNARNVFYERHGKDFFRQSDKDMVEEVDSLLYLYRHLTHSAFAGVDIPILTAATFERLRHGTCEQRCWFNSLLLSSLGMAVAIDFVPAWGNRNNSHTWNVIIKDGKSLAFESFWDSDRWKYKRIYNNQEVDKRWGRFRLPKVYRHTFKQHIEGPLCDEIPKEDIPLLFQNTCKKDVSHEYFETVDITVSLENIPHQSKYAYLCVFNHNQWQPVQWGKINNGKTIFKQMGKGIVYLPMYCINQTMLPAGLPFLLKDDGSLRYLEASDKKHSILTHHFNGAQAFVGNKEYNTDIVGSILLGCAEYPSFTDTLCSFNKDPELVSEWISHDRKRVRYIRMKLPHHYVSLGRLEFYERKDQRLQKINGVKIMQRLPRTENGEGSENILDDWSSSGYRQTVASRYIDFDLGDMREIEAIRFCPYLIKGYKEGVEYSLQYWDNEWKTIERKSGESLIYFSDVPQNALLLIRPTESTGRVGSRPFIFQDGEIQWF